MSDDKEKNWDDPILDLMDQIAKGCSHAVAKTCNNCESSEVISKDDVHRPPPMANPTWATGVSVPDGTSADNAKDSPLKLGPRGGKYEVKDGKKEYVKSLLAQAVTALKKSPEPVAVEERIDKALNSRSLVITPAMIRNMDAFRSATTQTSRAYTSLAHDARSTIEHLSVQNGPQARAQDDAERRSAKIEEIRRNLSDSTGPKQDIGPINIGNHRK